MSTKLSENKKKYEAMKENFLKSLKVSEDIIIDTGTYAFNKLKKEKMKMIYVNETDLTIYTKMDNTFIDNNYYNVEEQNQFQFDYKAYLSGDFSRVTNTLSKLNPIGKRSSDDINKNRYKKEYGFIYQNPYTGIFFSEKNKTIPTPKIYKNNLKLIYDYERTIYKTNEEYQKKRLVKIVIKNGLKNIEINDTLKQTSEGKNSLTNFVPPNETIVGTNKKNYIYTPTQEFIKRMELEVIVQSAYQNLFFSDEFKPSKLSSCYHIFTNTLEGIGRIQLVGAAVLFPLFPVTIFCKYIFDKFFIDESPEEKKQLYSDIFKLLEPISNTIEIIKLIVTDEKLKKHIYIDNEMIKKLEYFFNSLKNKVMNRLTNSQIIRLYKNLKKIEEFDTTQINNEDFKYVMKLIKSEYEKRKLNSSSFLSPKQFKKNYGIYRFFDRWTPFMGEKILLKLISDLTIINIHLTLITNNINLQLFSVIAKSEIITRRLIEKQINKTTNSTNATNATNATNSDTFSSIYSVISNSDIYKKCIGIK